MVSPPSTSSRCPRQPFRSCMYLPSSATLVVASFISTSLHIPPRNGQRSDSLRHFHSTRRPATCCAIVMRITEQFSCDARNYWVSQTSRLCPAHRGKILLPNALSARFVESTLTTSSYWAKDTCAGYSKSIWGYYHCTRNHLSLNKDPPIPRAIEPREAGKIVAFPVLGGLHHRYTRMTA